MRYRLKSSFGFSLIELLIALTLLGGVMGAAYSLHYYGLISFSRGESQLSLQQDVRFAAKLLSDEIRFASEIEIINDGSFEVKEGAVYYLADEEGNIVKRRRQNGITKDQPIAEGSGEYALRFVGRESGNWEDAPSGLLIEITVSGGTGNKKFELITTVLALNAAPTEKNSYSGSILCLSGL
ncbi:MAG TPA: prepilin-type N-terminal cleavage/methylation domain-containing protein [Firmicutes bacterium]|nr:prepilin-type N-terminal cleavage/methylation domain-containing protein [Bacillota bacterium]